MQKQIPPLRYGMTNNRTDNGKGNDGDSGLRLRSGQNDERRGCGITDNGEFSGEQVEAGVS
jgi:hypothetical protein